MIDPRFLKRFDLILSPLLSYLECWWHILGVIMHRHIIFCFAYIEEESLLLLYNDSERKKTNYTENSEDSLQKSKEKESYWSRLYPLDYLKHDDYGIKC